MSQFRSDLDQTWCAEPQPQPNPNPNPSQPKPIPTPNQPQPHPNTNPTQLNPNSILALLSPSLFAFFIISLFVTEGLTWHHIELLLQLKIHCRFRRVTMVCLRCFSPYILTHSRLVRDRPIIFYRLILTDTDIKSDHLANTRNWVGYEPFTRRSGGWVGSLISAKCAKKTFFHGQRSLLSTATYSAHDQFWTPSLSVIESDNLAPLHLGWLPDTWPAPQFLFWTITLPFSLGKG